MKQITLHIPDSNYSFFMELVKSLPFVKKIEAADETKKKSKLPADPKSKLMKDLKEAMSEVKLHKEGKIKLRTAEQLLNEL